MNADPFISLVSPCLIGGMAVFCLVQGVRPIVTRRPMLFSGRWMFFMLPLGFAPGLLPLYFSGTPALENESWGFAIAEWLPLVMFGVLLGFMWLTSRGYLALGVTDSAFRDAVLAALDKLDLPHEETLSAVRLPSVGADLQVAVQSWMGTGQIRMKQPGFAGMLREIVHGMNEHWRSSPPRLHLACCIFNILIGLLLGVAAWAFAVL